MFLNTPRCEFCQTQETVFDFLPMLGFKVDVRSLAKTEAEVEQDRPSGIIVCKNDVVGLHIPVHQSGFVTLILTGINQNPWAHFRRPIDMIFQG